MATERIQIIVEERGTRVVKRSIEDVGTSAERAQRGVNGLQAALAALGAAAVAREFLKMLDTFTNAQNRIRQVTTDTAQLRVVLAELQSIAVTTRGSFESTVEVYARVAQAVKDLGISQRETIEFTRTLNQLVALSGSSAQAANAAMVQLGQGLASGTLRGEELNSILEQLPNVADVIARGMGITRGELRKFGEEGKITAAVVLRAFRQAREEVAGNFARSVPTLAQAMIVLKNQAIELVGQFDTATGISEKFARAILFLGNNLELVARYAAAAGIAIATVLVARGINAAILGLRALTIAAATNPFTAILVAIVAVTGYLVAFSDQIRPLEGSLANLQEVAVAAWEQIRVGLQLLWNFAKSTFQSLVAAGQQAFAPIAAFAASAFGSVSTNFVDILRAAASMFDNLIGGFVGTFNAVVATFRNLPSAIGEFFIDTFNGALETIERFVNKAVGVINSVRSKLGLSLLEPAQITRIENGLRGSGQRLGQAVSEGFRAGFDVRPATALLEGTISTAQRVADAVTSRASTLAAAVRTRADQLAQERRARELQQAAEDEAARATLTNTGTNRTNPAAGSSNAGRRRETFASLFQELQDENAALRANSNERKALATVLQFEDTLRRQLTETERNLVLEMVRENQALDRLNQVYEDITGPQEKLGQRMQSLNTLLEQGRITLQQFTEEMRRVAVATTALDNSIGGGIDNALARLAERANDVGRNVSDFLVGAFDDATDAVVRFARTGKLSVGDFFADLAAQALKAASNQLIMSLFGTALGALSGSAGGTFSFSKAISSIGSTGGGLKGFATGGSAVVGGSGGVDSQMVAFRATPGERVDVSTRPQQRAADAAPPPAPQAIKIVNVIDPREAVSAMSSAAGERIILNTIERNPNVVRRLLGG